MNTSTESSSQTLPESLKRLASRTLTPTYKYVASHIAPSVTVLLGAPMVVSLAVVARFQPASLSWPLMTGAVLTLFASTWPATAEAEENGMATRPARSATTGAILAIFTVIPLNDFTFMSPPGDNFLHFQQAIYNLLEVQF